MPWSNSGIEIQPDFVYKKLYQYLIPADLERGELLFRAK
jgi:hypothetical protein